MALTFTALMTDHTAFPTDPGSEDAFRSQHQRLHSEARDYINAQELIIAPQLNKKVMSLSKATNISGDQIITTGFLPKLIRIVAVHNLNYRYGSEGTWTAADGTVTVLRFRDDTTATVAIDYMVNMHTGAASFWALVNTVNATGFTLTWGNTGTIDNGICKFKVEAFG